MLVHFKLKAIVSNMLLTNRQPIHLTSIGIYSLDIIFREVNQQELEQMNKTMHSFETVCEVTGKVKATRKASIIFSELVKNCIPSGCSPKLINEQGVISPSLLPGSVKHFINETVYPEYLKTVNLAVALVAWRSCTPVPIYSKLLHRLMWSLDGSSWNIQPMKIVFPGKSSNQMLVNNSNSLKGDVEQLISNNLSEPLGQELLREAWNLGGTNPRSALVTCIMAAEAGFKRLIRELIPDTTWLIQETPSPPIIKMIKDFLPKLPVKLKIDGQVKTLPGEQIDYLRKSVALRNSVVHGIESEVKIERLEKTILIVRDLLYLFDYYLGYSWALENIREETMQKLKQTGENT